MGDSERNTDPSSVAEVSTWSQDNHIVVFIIFVPLSITFSCLYFMWSRNTFLKALNAFTLIYISQKYLFSLLSTGSRSFEMAYISRLMWPADEGKNVTDLCKPIFFWLRGKQTANTLLNLSFLPHPLLRFVYLFHRYISSLSYFRY